MKNQLLTKYTQPILLFIILACGFSISPVQCDDPILSFSHRNQAAEPDEQFAAVCSDLVSYYDTLKPHVARTDGQINLFRLEVASSALSLAADIADCNGRHVRTEDLLSDLSSLVKRIADSASLEGIMRSHRSAESFADLLEMRQEISSEDFDVEVDMYVRSQLRSQPSGRPFLREIFNELARYTRSEVDMLIESFRTDAEDLLTNPETPHSARRHKNEHSNHSSDTVREVDRTKQIYRNHSLLMQAAASACEEIEDALPKEGPMRRMDHLLNLSQSFLRSIAFAYRQKSLTQVDIKQSERGIFAKHFAHMVNEMSKVEIRKRSHAPTPHIDTCMNLRTAAQQEAYMGELFKNNIDTQQVFDEFFPRFQECLDDSITRVGSAFEEYTENAFGNRGWDIDLDDGTNVMVEYAC